MKQIYTLLAAACISTAAFAGIDRTVRYEATRLKNVDTKELIAKQGVALKTTKLPDGMQRILNQDDNSQWATMIAIQDKLTEIYGFTDNQTGKPLTFEQMPYYDMIIAMQPMEGNSKAFYPLEILWPAYGALDDDLYNEETGAVDVEKCKARYGEKAFQPYEYADFIKDMTKLELGTTLFTMGGFYARPMIVGPEALTVQGQYMGTPCTNADGKTCYLKSSEIVPNPNGQGNVIDYSGATTLDWLNFDVDTSAVELKFNGKLTSVIGGPVTTTTTADLVGEAVVLGFRDILWDTIGEVHIFNGGSTAVKDEGEPWTWNYENVDDMQGPLNYYYLAMCDKTVTYQGTDQEGTTHYNYEEDELPQNEMTNGIAYGAPSFPLEKEQHYIYFACALWTPENAKPYGKWEMKTPVISQEGGAHYVQCPEAYNLVVYSNREDGAQDGLHGSYEGYIQPGVPEKCFIGIGDKNNGLNFLITSAMNYGHYIYGTYKGDITYHNVPGKWISEVTTLPAVSDLDADYVGPFVGVESVMEESNAPVVSRSFYNFQGQRLSSEPESGLYIIRSVKADGTVKAEKVAK